jgi:hypothetical protein
MKTAYIEEMNYVMSLLGSDDIAEEDIEASVFAYTKDSMLARRLIDCIPEAFGIILIGHMSINLNLPKTFSAKAKNGQWLEFEFNVEPIFVDAIKIAAEMFHTGPRSVFKNIASRSAMVNTVNRALNQAQSLNGATLSGPALIGIPAEIYLPKA